MIYKKKQVCLKHTCKDISSRLLVREDMSSQKVNDR